MEVIGLSALEDKLLAVGAALGEKALRKAAREAMKGMLDEARRLAPYDRGSQAFDYRLGRIIHLRDDIKLRAIKGGKDNSPTAITIRLGTSRKTKHYAAPTEFGRHEFNQSRTIRHSLGRKRGVYTVGATKPQPFMRPAFHNEKENTVRLFSAYLRLELKKAARLKARRERNKAT